MELILCGGGSGKAVKNSYKKYSEIIDKTKPLLYIPLAWKNRDYDACLKWLKEELKSFGITKFRVLKEVEEFNDIDLTEFNSIFIGGGNTYRLLNYLKKSKGYQKIEEYIKNNGIVFGGSAGSIIFGKDIKSANICSEDENLWPNLDTKGFNCLNNKSLACHYDNKNNKKEHDENIKKFEKTNSKVICLKENQSLYINNEAINLIEN